MEENKTEKSMEELKAWIPYFWNEHKNTPDTENFLNKRILLSDVHDNLTSYLYDKFDDMPNYLEDIQNSKVEVSINASLEGIHSLMNAVFDEMARVHETLHCGREDTGLTIFDERMLNALYDSLSKYLEFLTENNE